MKKSQMFYMPEMSWDKPIEEEILQYVRSMKRSWATHSSIWPHVNKAAETYASAYETVEKHILKEMEFRKSINQQRCDTGCRAAKCAKASGRKTLAKK